MRRGTKKGKARLLSCSWPAPMIYIHSLHSCLVIRFHLGHLLSANSPTCLQLAACGSYSPFASKRVNLAAATHQAQFLRVVHGTSTCNNLCRKTKKGEAFTDRPLPCPVYNEIFSCTNGATPCHVMPEDQSSEEETETLILKLVSHLTGSSVSSCSADTLHPKMP